MEEKNSITLFDVILIGLLFFTPIGWICLAIWIFIHLHPVYWLYRIARALENK